MGVFMNRLNDLKMWQSCIIKKIDTSNSIKRRLYDIGLVEGTKVKVMLVKKNIKAFLIRNSLIAIRNSDSKNILVGDISD